jgi:hypothetical protein
MKRPKYNILKQLVILSFLFVSLSALSQAPQKISYQAAVRNSSDLLIISQPIGMQLSIIRGSSPGTVVYSETQTATTSPNGIVSVEIGTGTLVSGNFATIDWTNGPYYIKTETDPTGGSTYTITGTTELLTVPFAFYSTKAGNSFTSRDYNELINKPVTDGSETKINAGTFVSVTGTGTIASPYVVNSNPVMGGFSHYIGEPYNGGIIFYLYKRQDGTEHALVVSLTETSDILQNPTSDTNADSFWDGAGNTVKYTNSPAVTWATGLGYGWYLPSVDELSLLWQNRFHVDKGLASVGGTPLSDANYWSSTEVSASTNLGWQLDLLSGNARRSQSKGSPEKVRAVRGMITTPTQLTTTAVTNVTNASASSGGSIVFDEGSPVIARGVCWSTSPNPTTGNSHTTDGAGIGSFSSSITGLTNNTTYYVRAYATNGAGTAYGNERSFTTASTTPVVTTTSASGLTKISASSGGNVTDERGEAVTARGVCWSTSPNPTLSDSFTTDGAGPGVFTSSLTGLTTGTLYYVRAYATNSVGTSYGNQVSFTTLAVPTVTTSATAYTSAGNGTSGGNVTNDGGVTVTARGVCWSTSTNPTLLDTYTTDGSGLGAFASALAGLPLGTTVYVRAYATSVEGTGYGNELTIKTLTIGDSYQGGKVAWLDGTGLHGLIISNIDLNSGANTPYSNVTGSLAGSGSVTDGQANTTAIISQGGYNSLGAATYCDAYSNGGYSDWYLPARDQWLNIWPNAGTLGIGGTMYWTSTEVTAASAIRLIGGVANNQSKVNTYRVRAVRTF